MTAIWTFIKSPIGLALIGFIALMTYVQIQRHDAAAGAKAECNAAQIQSNADDLQRKLDIATQLANDNAARADKTQADLDTLEKARADLLAAMDADKGNSRQFPPAILARMHALAATASSGSNAAPKAGRP